MPERVKLSYADLYSQPKLLFTWARRQTPLSKAGKIQSVGAEEAISQPAAQPLDLMKKKVLPWNPAPRVQERRVGVHSPCVSSRDGRTR